MSATATVPNPAASKVTVTYINEKPTAPAETNDVKYDVKEVTRTVKTVDGENTSGKFILVPIAKTIHGMELICNGKLEDVLEHFNDGLWNDLRSDASNELSGGSPEDKAFARVAKAVAKLPLFSGKSSEEIVATLRENPALMSLFGK